MFFSIITKTITKLPFAGNVFRGKQTAAYHSKDELKNYLPEK